MRFCRRLKCPVMPPPHELPDWAKVEHKTRWVKAWDATHVRLFRTATKLLKIGEAIKGQEKEDIYKVPRLIQWEGKRPQIYDNVFVAPSAHIIGDVIVGRKSYIGYNAIIRGDTEHTLLIGESCSVQEKAVVIGATTLGKWVTIEPMAIVENADIASCTFIGTGAVVCNGARIESNVMLCAHSVLRAGAVIPSGEIWAGSPAHKIGVLNETERDQMIAAAKHMVLIGIEHRDSWELGWDELDSIREAREAFALMNMNTFEFRIKAMYVREPPRPDLKGQTRPSPREIVNQSRHTPAKFELG